MFALLLIFKEIGRALVLMLALATTVFCLQQAVTAYALEQHQLMAQAVGSSLFFGAVIFLQIHQMIFAPRGSAPPSRIYEECE